MSDFDRLIIRKLSGNISPEEEAALNAWLRRSQVHRQRFRRIMATWELTGSADPELPDIDEAWRELEQRLQLGRSNGSAGLSRREVGNLATPPSAKRSRTVFYAAMAAVLLAATAIVTFWQFTRDPFLEVVTANAQRQVVTLPDGSIVRLNNASAIRYHRDPDGPVRLVELSGEAYFEVVAATTPFVVMTDNARIQVLGTAFNVWCRRAETRVVVNEGEVMLGPAQNEPEIGGAIVLSRSQSGRIAGPQDAEMVALPDAAVPWLEDRIVFSETSLAEVVEELERIYDARIRLADPGLGQLSMTGAFDKKTLDAILSAIALALDISYTRESGSHVLRPRATTP